MSNHKFQYTVELIFFVIITLKNIFKVICILLIFYNKGIYDFLKK